ncbi:MAG: BlaI/MecI/CopY family transcriptional regulator [Gammaproteobacteria bacterium]
MSPRPAQFKAAASPEPTEAELELLRVLWRLGPVTVRQVHDALPPRNGETAYTTILSTLQIMHQKRLVSRDESERAHVYSAMLSQDQAQQQLLGKLLHRVFEGSTTALVMQALGSAKPASMEEIEKIRARLDELEGQGK